jgi:hypothetical protein
VAPHIWALVVERTLLLRKLARSGARNEVVAALPSGGALPSPLTATGAAGTPVQDCEVMAGAVSYALAEASGHAASVRSLARFLKQALDFLNLPLAFWAA